MRALLITLCFSLAVAVPLASNPTNARQHVSEDTDVLNVHIVPHTHDDVGWLKTVDEYFAGKNETIQKAAVHQIITSVMDSLAKNSDRKFIYVEMAFFWRWWNEQDDTRKEQVRNFVNTGQLEFINGGWCMHDEASPHFQAMIDQTTEGHRFIKENFNATPKVQWQIDPFGHSSANAELSVQMGMDSLFFARSDYADYQNRIAKQEMEMEWRASESLGTTMFTHILFDHYGPPAGFDWDVYNSAEPIQDDKNLEDYNVDSRMADFKAYCDKMSKIFRTNNIILTMGSDFEYRNAEDWFTNLDKLIKYSKSDKSLNVFYSTPSIYIDAVRKAGSDWPTKTDDFFPYGDHANSYWTGYFTSRPALKRFDRYSMAYLQACKQVEADSTAPTTTSFPLREAMGINQHHDAVSGTEKQHVAFDYAKRLAKGIHACEEFMGSELAVRHGLKGTKFENCHYLNVSACEHSVGRTGRVALSIYNSVGRKRSVPIRIPVSSAKGARVIGPDGKNVTSQVFHASETDIKLGWLEAGKAATGNYTLVFIAEQLPPVGNALYTLDFDADSTFVAVGDGVGEQLRKPRPSLPRGVLNNGIVEAMLSGSYGLSSIRLLSDNTTAKVSQNFLRYYSSVGNSLSDQKSGAYIFRPNQNSAEPIGFSAFVTSFVEGPLVQEFRYNFTGNITQVARLYKGSNHVELEWTVGPIGCNDGWGKEIVSRLTSDIDSSNTWHTDSNGREMLERTRNFRATWDLDLTEPVSQNYYPVNTAISIEDDDRRLTVLTDRSQGGTSLASGEIELMVHRHTVQDDSRGVGEPLAEPGVDGKGLIVRGKHYVQLSAPDADQSSHYPLAVDATYEPILFFSVPDPADATRTTATSSPDPRVIAGMTADLPPSVHLLTKQVLDDGHTTYLVRLNDMRQQSAEAKTSKPATVSLQSIFPSAKISSAVEMMLSANKLKEDDPIKPDGGFAVSLLPMEIRTFEIVVTETD